MHAETMKAILEDLKMQNMSYEFSDFIDSLSHEQRIEIREAAAAAGIEKLPRNLFYDYQKQTWIGEVGK